MLHDFSVSQIVSRIFQVHGNLLPKEMSSDRCTLCFAHQVWNCNDLLRNVVPSSNLGSCPTLNVTLKETTKSKVEDVLLPTTLHGDSFASVSLLASFFYIASYLYIVYLCDSRDDDVISVFGS